MTEKTILVIDDDADVRLSLKVRLSTHHYNVIFAVDGVSSIAVTRKHMPDLIILDLGLPAGDGFAVFERLKANESFALIPVIVVSGRDRFANRERAIKAGARIFLQKAVDNEHLLSLIRQILAAKQSVYQEVYDLGHPDEPN